MSLNYKILMSSYNGTYVTRGTPNRGIFEFREHQIEVYFNLKYTKGRCEFDINDNICCHVFAGTQPYFMPRNRAGRACRNMPAFTFYITPCILQDPPAAAPWHAPMTAAPSPPAPLAVCPVMLGFASLLHKQTLLGIWMWRWWGLNGGNGIHWYSRGSLVFLVCAEPLTRRWFWTMAFWTMQGFWTMARKSPMMARPEGYEFDIPSCCFTYRHLRWDILHTAIFQLVICYVAAYSFVMLLYAGM